MIKAFGSLNIHNRWFITTLFGILFLYLIIRAITVTPLLDELGTLHWFIQTGDILNSDAVIDANNHLLNSFISHYLFRLFGDHLIVYRLLALCSFPIYFFATKKLVKENIKQFQLVIFLSLISIHWIFDYFSLSRGYGPSLAFFMLGLSYISSWNKTSSLKALLIILFSFSLCLLSNLSMFVPIGLVFGYLHITFLLNWKTNHTKTKLFTYLISSAFITLMFFLYQYVQTLKNAGALWWGSKAGLWEVTGVSVSKNIFFTDSVLIKYGLIVVLTLLVVVLLRLFLKNNWKLLFFSIDFWAITLLVLCLTSTVVMVHFMGVNYPQDRVAMYMVVLLIISMGSLLSDLKYIKWGLLFLLWFPITFLVKANTDTTIFSPQDRISSSFYNEVRKKIGPNDILEADYVAHICYAYATRKETKAKMAILNESNIPLHGDYHLSSYYRKIKDWKQYTCILTDPTTNMKLYKFNGIKKYRGIRDSVYNLSSNAMFINLMDFNLNNYQRNIKIITDGSITTNKGSLNLNLIEDLSTSKSNDRNYNSTLFNWYFGLEKVRNFNYSRSLPIISDTVSNLKVYIYNPEQLDVKLNNFQVKVMFVE